MSERCYSKLGNKRFGKHKMMFSHCHFVQNAFYFSFKGLIKNSKLSSGSVSRIPKVNPKKTDDFILFEYFAVRFFISLQKKTIPLTC